MNIKWFLIIVLLFGSGFGCQGLAQKKDEIKQNDLAVKSDPVKLTLNMEDQGTTADTSVLVKKLEEIFQARAENGVLREGTNEVEKLVYLQGDRLVSAEEIAKLYTAVKASGASPIRFAIQINDPSKKQDMDLRPNPLTLLVSATLSKDGGVEDNDENKVRPVLDDLGYPEGIEIGFMGELFEDPGSASTDNGAILVVADKNGTLSIGGKQISSGDLKTEIEKRLKTKEQDKKIVYVRAENYGNIEDAGGIAALAGAAKVIVITKNTGQKENGISFSLSPGYLKDKEREQTPEYSSVSFIGSDSSFEITFSEELFDSERVEWEISNEFEQKKERVLNGEGYTDAEVSLTKIDGLSGVLTIQKEKYYRANWFGFRKKDGKQQLVIIVFQSSPAREIDYSHYEFLKIMNSIKLN